MKETSAPATMAASTVVDRLQFAMWLAQLTRGCDRSDKAFAAAIGKSTGQLSQWLNGHSRIGSDTAKQIGKAIGLSGSWLRDPDDADARVPGYWEQWWEARQRWVEEHQTPVVRTQPALTARSGLRGPQTPPPTKKAATRAANEKGAKGR